MPFALGVEIIRICGAFYVAREAHGSATAMRWDMVLGDRARHFATQALRHLSAPALTSYGVSSVSMQPLVRHQLCLEIRAYMSFKFQSDACLYYPNPTRMLADIKGGIRRFLRLQKNRVCDAVGVTMCDKKLQRG